MSTDWYYALWTDQLRSREGAPGGDGSLRQEIEIGRDDCTGRHCIKSDWWCWTKEKWKRNNFCTWKRNKPIRKTKIEWCKWITWKWAAYRSREAVFVSKTSSRWSSSLFLQEGTLQWRGCCCFRTHKHSWHLQLKRSDYSLNPWHLLLSCWGKQTAGKQRRGCIENTIRRRPEVFCSMSRHPSHLCHLYLWSASSYFSEVLNPQAHSHLPPRRER